MSSPFIFKNTRTASSLLSVTAVILAGPIAAEAQTLTPTNVVSNSYHSPEGTANNYDRASAFAGVKDGDLTLSSAEGFDTFENLTVFPGESINQDGTTTATTDFAGLIFSNPSNPAQLPVRLDSVTLNFGFIFGDGGRFDSTPNLYLLTTNIDPDEAPPESTAGYVQIIGAAPTTAANSITFTLTGLPEAQRTGYGWAIGGIPGGDGTAGGANVHFISVSELSSTGAVIPEPATAGLLGVAAAGLLLRRQRRQG